MDGYRPFKKEMLGQGRGGVSLYVREEMGMPRAVPRNRKGAR